MKTVYIPRGETVNYESLVTERLVVKGCLHVTYGVKAKVISGDGVIYADKVQADEICMGDLETSTIICKRLIAKRVQTPELFASESAAVSCFLSAAYVETEKLTVAISEIDQVKAGEVVNLPRKKSTLFGTLLRSALRSLWTTMTMSGAHGEAVDAEYTVEQPQTAENAVPAQTESAANAAERQLPKEEPAPVDEELNRFINTFKLLRESGYTLKIIPGTPEETAPVFDFENQRIVRPAA
jgi:hypothetical protein